MSILDKILATKRQEIAAAKAVEAQRFPDLRTLATMKRDAAGAYAAEPPPPALPLRSLTEALRRPTGAPVRVLSEIKRASPSAGPIRPGADPVAIAREYAAAGAAAISVLTDRQYFDGDLAFLLPVREAVPVPVLRKDFLIDPWQLSESVGRADAVLLIAAAMPTIALQAMLRETRQRGLEALVEVHTLAELDAALSAPRPPALIGVNHRDLATFAIDMTLTEQIAKRVPPGTVLVAESGIKTAADVRRLGDAGAHAVLVGEQLMRAPSPGDALRELLA